MHFSKDMRKNSIPVGALAFNYAPVVQPAATAAQMQARAAFVRMPSSGTTSQQTGVYRAALKQMFDVAVVLLATPVVIPVMIVLALLVAADGGKPFYRQTRVGRGGTLYTMWKLRTMVPDADAALAAYLAANLDAAAEWDATQKLKADPRITRVGRILRRTSLDELPQLLNVIRGEMALVGPRPMMPEQQDMYPGTAYYKLLPGITGPWQVSARNETTFAARAYFDSRYERSVSFLGDLKMLVATCRVVARATGY